MSVSDATITTTTATQFLPTTWVHETTDAVEFAAILQKRVNRQLEKEVKVGNTVKVRRLSNLSTQTKSSGVLNTVVFEAINLKLVA